MKWLGVFVLPLDGMLVHRRSLPRNFLGFPNNLLVPIYERELSVLPKNTTQCPWSGLELGPLAPGTSALTINRPLRLPLSLLCRNNKHWESETITIKGIIRLVQTWAMQCQQRATSPSLKKDMIKVLTECTNACDNAKRYIEGSVCHS